jgi:hypothetical protein
LKFISNLTEGSSCVGGGLFTWMHTKELITVLIILLEIKHICLNAVMLNSEVIFCFLKGITSQSKHCPPFYKTIYFD